ncbi:homoserine O-acetyltransferase MetA [Prescottella equi]|uniref:Homoserine O-acetyltransferase n=1 Tax=Rhodococcus hoagii TaxID=43767 RepID=A0AAE5MKM4_RHOHA|nr:homoserine O-succinyltransferase [Prescottella equi]MBM4625320.1 homoserine O-succinyltransferase [Prescottella equi]ORL28212.1 homoserine O-succinyltransferase [Prescottella equi]ORM04452.1 homoserine O-succinyltransferase [Prescottella equi]ORM31160.1 homoserine O-succinyltransferase [Prescottella equi]QPQ75233.1 homoserine O-succinyltransferase [Prescottella equi]
MPVNVPRDLPARAILEAERIFVMSDERAGHQDIRPMRIAILNLMPLKVSTETQLLRLLSNNPLQIEITLLHMASHVSRTTSAEHLESFYSTFDDVAHMHFDGLIVTGAPIEKLDFEDVDYWPEMTKILDWARGAVQSTLHVCWGAQAALYHYYGVGKHEVPQKISGVFPHRLTGVQSPIVTGFDDEFLAPHSRHTDVHAADIEATGEVDVLAVSDEAGVYLAATPDGRQVFVTGHPEYDADTLAREYRRDSAQGLPIAAPAHYFPGDDPAASPLNRWRGHGHLLYSNWLNYCVYQETPFLPGDV